MKNEIKSDINILLNQARNLVEQADKTGNSKLFNEVGEKYGPIAHRVYLALNKPSNSWSFDIIYSKKITPVLLDPSTVVNRMNSHGIGSVGIGIDHPEFWIHADMVKTLCDYLILIKDRYASETSTASN